MALFKYKREWLNSYLKKWFASAYKYNSSLYTDLEIFFKYKVK